MERFMEIKNGRAQINIGKHGITPTFLEHLKKILKKEKIVKIKVLREISQEQGNEKLINKIIEEINVFILDSRGNTFMISKKKLPAIHLPKKYLDFKKTIHLTKEQKKPEIEIKELEAIATNDDFVEPEYIDYDNKELISEIDQQSDLLYGSASESREMDSHEKMKKTRVKHYSKQKKSSKVKKQFKNKKKLRKLKKKKR